MQNRLRYTIFETAWGFFGLAADADRIGRSQLPVAGRDDAESRICAWAQSIGAEATPGETALLKTVRRWIEAYLETGVTDFADVEVDLTRLSPFARAVLTACRRIGPGRTVAYSQLAARLRRPNAARAVGGALSRNPVPLIIPCHRVLRSDGKIGGFTAPGGGRLKKRLIEHERSIVP